MLAAGLLAGCPKQQPPPQTTDERPVEEPAVDIYDVSPSSTTEGNGVTVTVTGRGFEAGSEIYLGSRSARGVDVYDDGEMTFRASEDLPSGTYDVRVVTPAGDQAVEANGFRVKSRKTEESD